MFQKEFKLLTPMIVMESSSVRAQETAKRIRKLSCKKSYSQGALRLATEQ